MSEKEVNRAVEKSWVIRPLQKRYMRSPRDLLTGSFDLLPGEWTSIAWCLQRDIENAMAQQNTLSEGFFSSVDYQLISQVPKLSRSSSTATKRVRPRYQVSLSNGRGPSRCEARQ